MTIMDPISGLWKLWILYQDYDNYRSDLRIMTIMDPISGLWHGQTLPCTWLRGQDSPRRKGGLFPLTLEFFLTFLLLRYASISLKPHGFSLEHRFSWHGSSRNHNYHIYEPRYWALILKWAFSFDCITHCCVTVFWLNVEFAIFGEIHFPADLTTKLVQNFPPTTEKYN